MQRHRCVCAGCRQNVRGTTSGARHEKCFGRQQLEPFNAATESRCDEAAVQRGSSRCRSLSPADKQLSGRSLPDSDALRDCPLSEDEDIVFPTQLQQQQQQRQERDDGVMTRDGRTRGGGRGGAMACVADVVAAVYSAVRTSESSGADSSGVHSSDSTLSSATDTDTAGNRHHLLPALLLLIRR